MKKIEMWIIAMGSHDMSLRLLMLCVNNLPDITF